MPPIDTLEEYVISLRARRRMRARRISAEAVGAALQYGRCVHQQGLVFHHLGLRQVEAARAFDGLCLEAYHDVCVMCSHEGVVITVFRGTPAQRRSKTRAGRRVSGGWASEPVRRARRHGRATPA